MRTFLLATSGALMFRKAVAFAQGMPATMINVRYGTPWLVTMQTYQPAPSHDPTTVNQMATAKAPQQSGNASALHVPSGCSVAVHRTRLGFEGRLLPAELPPHPASSAQACQNPSILHTRYDRL
jgi:outer membrane biosynthesis protein TonB